MADSEEGQYRTLRDIERTVKAIARHFKTDVVVIIGSQAIQLANPNPPKQLLFSKEIDAYPDNARDWEAEREALHAEASEEINGLFGDGSHFQKAFGFYIDGVDETSATLPAGWRERANRLRVTDEDRVITAIAPRTEDLVVSKLCALRPKDKAYIRVLNADDELDIELIRSRLDDTPVDPGKKRLALDFLDVLARERDAARANEELPAGPLPSDQ